MDWALAPLKVCLCVLLLTLSWAVWSITRTVQGEAAVLNKALAQEQLEINNTVNTHSLALTGMERELAGDIGDLSARGDGTLEDLDGAAQRLQATLDAVNRDCAVAVHGKPCGTLADLNKTLKEIRGDAGDIGVAMRHEDRNLSDFDATVMKVDLLLDSANDAVKKLTPVEVGVTQLIEQAQPIAAHVNGMTDSGDKMLADAQWKEHQLLHPNKKKVTFWGAVDGGVMWFHSHLMPPIF